MELTNKNFQGIFRYSDMIPDCVHQDGLIINFYCRGNVLNINIYNPATNGSIGLFETDNFYVTNHNNNSEFKINTNIQGAYNELRGTMYGENDGTFFKLYIPNYGWRYFEKFRD